MSCSGKYKKRMFDPISSLAGIPVPQSLLVDIPRLITAYFTLTPNPAIAAQRVVFGTSGHRGSALATGFNEAHVLAITQSICMFRRSAGITGPLFLGMDSHGLSEPAFASTLEVLAGNGVETMIDDHHGYTPTPVISHAILGHNRGRATGLADGIVISPSHNPPDEGGFKYNPPNGGPADLGTTSTIERTANMLLQAHNVGVVRIPYERACRASCVHARDYITAYVADLAGVIEMDRIRAAGVRIGIDPLGGAAIAYWQPIIERYRIVATVVNDSIDPTFRFMTVDRDGKIRMDCSSPYAMTRLIGLQDQFDIAFGNDTDADRHGIVCPTGGLMPPNEFLTAAIGYLCSHRPAWRANGSIGKTAVSSAMIDKIAARCGRRIFEVPVGFKWFSAGLIDGSLAFGGEESAGASFVRRDGSVWTTDKDGLIMGLLAAEMTARTGQDPNRFYSSITRDFEPSFYARVDAPASPDQKMILADLDPAAIAVATIAGEPITAKSNHAAGNDAALGGIKVTTANAWFAARPSGTEDVYKIYAESFVSANHLEAVQREAQALVTRLFESS